MKTVKQRFTTRRLRVAEDTRKRNEWDFCAPWCDVCNDDVLLLLPPRLDSCFLLIFSLPVASFVQASFKCINSIIPRNCLLALKQVLSTTLLDANVKFRNLATLQQNELTSPESSACLTSDFNLINGNPTTSLVVTLLLLCSILSGAHRKRREVQVCCTIQSPVFLYFAPPPISSRIESGSKFCSHFSYRRDLLLRPHIELRTQQKHHRWTTPKISSLEGRIIEIIMTFCCAAVFFCLSLSAERTKREKWNEWIVN